MAGGNFDGGWPVAPQVDQIQPRGDQEPKLMASTARRRDSRTAGRQDVSVEAEIFAGRCWCWSCGFSCPGEESWFLLFGPPVCAHLSFCPVSEPIRRRFATRQLVRNAALLTAVGLLRLFLGLPTLVPGQAPSPLQRYAPGCQAFCHVRGGSLPLLPSTLDCHRTTAVCHEYSASRRGGT